MLTALYYHLFIMSIVTGCLYLILKLCSKATMKCFSASWHYYTYIAVSLFLILPYHKLLVFLSLIFRQKSENESFLSTLPSIIRMPLSASNDVGVAMDKAMFHFVLLPYFSLVGTVIFIAVMVVQNYKLRRRIMGVCRLVNEERTLDALSRCKESIGISKRISIYVSPYTNTPFLYGAFKPCVVLPNDTFTDEELEHMFLHELTHWKRHDTCLKFLMLLINAVLWFNPLAYLVRRDVDRFCELSCDERIAVAMDIEEKERYCELLLSVLSHAAVQNVKLYSALSNMKQIEMRIDTIMKTGDWESRKWIRLLATIITAVLLLMGGVTAFAASESTIEISDDVIFVDSESVVFSEIAMEEIHLEDDNANLLEENDAVLFEGANNSNLALRASGNLSAGASYSYDKQYLATGQKVTINAN